MEPQRFLTENKVAELTTLHRTQIARMVKTGAFPAPVYISSHRKAWPEAEIVAWMEAVVASRPLSSMRQPDMTKRAIEDSPARAAAAIK